MADKPVSKAEEIVGLAIICIMFVLMTSRANIFWAILFAIPFFMVGVHFIRDGSLVFKPPTNSVDQFRNTFSEKLRRGEYGFGTRQKLRGY